MSNWWNNNIKHRLSDFKIWTGDFDYPSKVYVRKHVAKNKYESIIDCGCGLAVDFFGFKKDNYEISYTGLDSCKAFIDSNREKNINMIEAELDGYLSISDNSYDCSYCREVLEHLPFYDKALAELIRIAKKEVIIVFFIQPDDKEEINYWEEEGLYHNKYNKRDLEKYILDIPKVDKLYWECVEDFGYTDRGDSTIQKSNNTCQKYILHVMLNN